MKYLSLTLPTPQENLACDEALLDLCEAGEEREILRCWRPETHFIVLGLANAHQREVHLAASRRGRIPILRRCSGGGTVLQGPGCLNYSLILEIGRRRPLHSITGTTCYVLQRHRRLLESLTGEPVAIRGISDLTIGSRKCSGNAQRRRQRCVLVHGSFLVGLDLPLVQRVLRTPPRQPPYRRGRSHTAFLTNLAVAPEVLAARLRRTWGATDVLDRVPQERIERLVSLRYARDAWNYKL